MKLCAGERRGGSSGVCDASHESPGPDVGEGPVLVRAGGQHVVPGGVEGEAGHRTLVHSQQLQQHQQRLGPHSSTRPIGHPYLHGLRGRHVPDPDSGVVRPGDDGVLLRVVDDTVHLLGVALQHGHHLNNKIKKRGGHCVQ